MPPTWGRPRAAKRNPKQYKLVINLNGDNGASAEGGPLGTPDEVAFFNGVAVRQSMAISLEQAQRNNQVSE